MTPARSSIGLWSFSTAAVLAAAVLGAFLLCVCAPSASAAAPAPLAKVPEDGKPGDSAGQFDLPSGVAADPQLPGNVYVIDRPNARIQVFTPWGEFVKAWGWAVNEEAPEAKLQTCTAQTGCKAGSKGGGAGQFNVPTAIAIDGAGDVYVIDVGAHRVQKFDPTGGPSGEEAEFILTFGREVNKTKTDEGAPQAQRDLCTAASGDVCQAGAAGTATENPAWLGGSTYFGALTVNSTEGAVFVGEGEQIQRFSLGGAFEEVIEGGCLAGQSIRSVASDQSGRLYVAFDGSAEVRRLAASGPTATCEPSGLFKPEDPAERPKALALDGNDNLYVVEFPLGEEPTRVHKFDPAGVCLTCGSEGEGGEPGFDRSDTQLQGIAATTACEAEDAYVLHFRPSPQEAYFRAFGDPPKAELCPPPPNPPSIEAQYALSVETKEATLRAEINPRFWSGTVGTTTYYVQYASEECLEAGGWEAACVEEYPAPPAVLGGSSVGTRVKTAPILLEGLSPGATYHYRFVSEGSGEPGKEIIGVGGIPDNPGTEALFRTFRPSSTESCLQNEAFRTGPSALLPDCRAYEMVSPVDKEGGDIAVLPELGTQAPAVLSQSSLDGERLVFGSARSFDAESAPFTTQYLAARKAGQAWATHGISAPHGETVYQSALAKLDTELKALSPDLCHSWFQSYSDLPPALEPLAPLGFTNLFHRGDEECGGASYKALNTVTPPSVTGEAFHVELQGVSQDGSTAIFLADDALAEGATPATLSPDGSNLGPSQLYASRGSQERFLCVLPDGSSWTGSCMAGGSTVSLGSKTRTGNVTGAFSADGELVYWSTNQGGEAPVYLRQNPFNEGPECEASGPCTVAVSRVAEEEAGTLGKGSQFWAAATDGSKAIFGTGGRLYEWRREDESTHLIAGGMIAAPLGQSADLSRIYFVSTEAKGGPNTEGKAAAAGQRNLYFYEDGQFDFIGVLEGGDDSFLPIEPEPFMHTARVSADGLHAAFKSAMPLTGYDNTDAASGKADTEVFLYDAAANSGGGELLCVSCNPGNARPHGAFDKAQRAPTAAQIPGFANSLYAPRVLSEDGSRLFFESYDALTPRDTNGVKDVYQWQAPGSGDCDEESSGFSPFNKGCVDLISSGKSARGSDFVDADPSGENVFFATLSGLLPQDPGLVDVYDARVDGGLPSPQPPPPPCVGEACQNPTSPSAFATPSSESYEGPQDANQEATVRRRCPKGKQRVKSRCVKKRSQRSSKRNRTSNSNRRSSR